MTDLRIAPLARAGLIRSQVDPSVRRSRRFLIPGPMTFSPSLIGGSLLAGVAVLLPVTPAGAQVFAVPPAMLPSGGTVAR